MVQEEWKEIEGYQFYKISNTGRIKTCRKGKGKVNWYELKLRTNHKTNYIYAGLYDAHGNRKWFRVHRLVYHHFISGIPDTLVVDHIDNNKQNNNYTNLQLLTLSENTLKYHKHKKTNV